MKACLAKGYPFIFLLRPYAAVSRARLDGIVGMPTPHDLAAQKQIGHTMLAVGYDNSQQRFIVRNSWGPNWGKAGYCYIPYQYMINTKYCLSAWVIGEVDTTNLGSEHWNKNDLFGNVQSRVYRSGRAGASVRGGGSGGNDVEGG
ncbi:unnamed protein product, partial [Rotaria sp. Silwood1]